MANFLKTQAEWEQEYKEVAGDEYTFLEDYVSYNVPIKCEHNKCGNVFEITPIAFCDKRRKYRCPLCKNNKGIEKYQKKLEDKFDDSYVILEKITGGKGQLRIQHKPCGSETLVRTDRISTWRGCPNCTVNKRKQAQGKSKKRTNEEWVAEVKEMVGDEYTFLEPYVDAKTPITCRHNLCGYEWKTKPNRFKAGSRCIKCRAKNRMKTNDEFVKEVFDMVGDEYTFLEEYKGATTPIKYRHNTCGTEYTNTPNHFLTKRGFCTKCN